MKTIFYKDFSEQLASINNQIIFHLFTAEELLQTLSNYSPSLKKSQYTTDVFTKNIYAEKIHVRISDLNLFYNKNVTHSFYSYFSTAYEIIKIYMIKVLELLKKVNPSTYNDVHMDEPEETFFRTLNNSGCLYSINYNYIDTLRYFRLRRNHYIHLSKNLSKKFNDFIDEQIVKQATNSDLNSFWTSKTNRQNLLFSSKSVNSISKDEIIDIMLILKIILNDIDVYIASHLNDEGIIRYINLMEYPMTKKYINQELLKHRAKKIKKLSYIHFGKNFTIEQIITHLN